MISLGDVSKGIKVDSVIFVLGTLSGFVFVPLVLRYLSLEEYGLYISVIGIVSVLTLADFGMALYATRKLSGMDVRNEGMLLLSSMQLFQYGLAVLLALIGYAFSFLLDFVLNHPADISEVRYFFAFTWTNFICLSVFSLCHAVLRAHGNLAFLNSSVFAIQLLSYVFGLILLHLGYGLSGLGFGALLAGLTVTSFVVIKIKKISGIGFFWPRRRYCSVSCIADGWGYTKRFQLLKLSQVMKTSLFTVLVANLSGPSVAAMHAITNKMPQIFPAFFSKVVQNYTSLFSRLFETGDLDLLKSEFRRLFLFGIGATSFVILSLFLMNDSFIEVWVGSGKYVGDGIFIFMLANTAVLLMNAFLGLIVQVAGDFRKAPVISLFEAILFVGGTYALGVFWDLGLKGIVISLLVCSSVSLIYSLWLVGEVLGLSLADLAYDSAVECVVLLLGLYSIHFALSQFQIHTLPNLLLQAGLNSAFFLLWLVVRKKRFLFRRRLS